MIRGEDHMKGDAAVLKELIAGNQNLAWLSKNFSELKKKYPKKFVAIKNQNVVLADSSLKTLIKTLKKKFGDPSNFFIDFIPDDNYFLVV
jgi:hypothetical protein